MERVATKEDLIPLRYPVKGSDGRLITEVPISPGQVRAVVVAVVGGVLTADTDTTSFIQAVLIPIIAVHRMDHVWKDADEFRPERWLGDLPPREQLTSGWGNMLSFSDGPRHCPGIRLGKSSSALSRVQAADDAKWHSAQLSSSTRYAGHRPTPKCACVH